MRRLSATPASARARIVGWLVLLVACALGVEVLVVGRALTARAEAQVTHELEHEATKFRGYARDHGREFTTSKQLLDAYLQANLPNDDETFFSVVSGRADSRSAQRPPVRVDLDLALVAAAADATEPVSGSAESAAGPIRYAVLQAEVGATTGALVIVEFTREGRSRAVSTARLVALVGFGTLALAGLVSWLLAGRVLAPVGALRRNAQQITETDLTRRIPVTGDDEVSDMARTFNSMLDRLEQAFAGQRAFLDDASHELRTPLTVVRGHIELIEDDSFAERDLVLAELDRMGRLVDDLMLLARSERPGFLKPAPTDLTDLVVDVTAKAGALAPRRWQLDALAEGRVVADEQRLTQALLQLAANAVQHTEPGDTIGIGARLSGPYVDLWVRDDGRGIDAAEHDRIFERSTRAEGAPRGGLGLGLTIVRSIAEAHGGSVSVDSALGHGATFTIRLPLAGPGKEQPR